MKELNYKKNKSITIKKWKRLGEVIKIQYGKEFIKSQLEKSGNYAVFQNSTTPIGYYYKSNVKSDTTFIVRVGTAGEIGYSDVDFWAADGIYYFQTPDNIKSKFLYYFLLTQRRKILSQVRRASIPNLSKIAIEKLQIPILSLKEQEYIVSTLDKFNTLVNAVTDELQQEVELRKKQYEYYRDTLIKGSEIMTELNHIKKILNEVEIEWKSLWEVTYWDKKFKAVESYKQPKIIKYKYLPAKKVKELIIDNGDIKILTTNISDLWTTEEKVKDYIAKGEVVAIPGGGRKPMIQYYKGKFVTTNNRLVTSRNIYYLDNKYLYYFLINQIKKIKSFYRGAGMKYLNVSQVFNLQIPIPPLEVQKEIVYILDTFTKLIAELTTELIARKKQYEYYRDIFLNFSKIEE